MPAQAIVDPMGRLPRRSRSPAFRRSRIPVTRGQVQGWQIRAISDAIAGVVNIVMKTHTRL